MNIIVLAGGSSTERDVSIVSGTQVAGALRKRGHRAVLMDVFAGDENLSSFKDDSMLKEQLFAEDYDLDGAVSYIRSFNDRIEQMLRDRRSRREGFFGPNVLRACRTADVVFLALHGSNGEDGRIQAVFDLMDIPYTGCGYLGSAMAMDKEIAKQMFRAENVSTPRGIALRRQEVEAKGLPEGMTFPCVVKPCCGGSSVGVSIVHDREEFEKALEEAFRYEDSLIVEEYISGREFSVGIVDGKVYPVIEIAPVTGFYDYHNKYMAGSTVETCPADLPEPLTQKMQAEALKAYHALRLNGYGRIDIMMDAQEHVYCLEANTLPGMTPTSLLPQEAAALGIDFAALCELLIDVSLGRNQAAVHS